jgi:Collagen triple helix repeat (20 copies)
MKLSVPLLSIAKGFFMNRSILVPALLVALSLAACDKPTVVNVPATPVAVPGPAGPAGPAGDPGVQGNTGNQGDAGVKGNQGDTGVQGDTGSQGDTGDQGDTGKTGDGTTVIVVLRNHTANYFNFDVNWGDSELAA